MKHENGVEICSRCETKLQEAHPHLKVFFQWVKINHPDAHVSWTFRDQANQDECFRMGKSKLQWPKSPHNAMDLFGKPCSEAIDLFVLSNDGKAEWPTGWFKTVSQQMKDAGMPFKWGGDFKTLGDADHFQMA